jgi:hypothetical protein
MDCPVQPVLDRLMPADRTGLDQTVAKLVPYHGPVQQWSGFPFTQKRPVWTHGPDRDPCGTVDRTVTRTYFL